MSDGDFLAFCGFSESDFRDDDHRQRVLASLAPRRLTIEHMADMAMEINLWTAGLGPKPSGILID